MTHIYGPVKRKGYLFKHSPVAPLAISSLPANRVGNVLFSFPPPVRIAPQGAIFVATGGYELQILAIRHFVAVDGEGRKRHETFFILVVPAKGPVTAGAAQCRHPFGNLDHLGLDGRSCEFRRRCLGNLLLVRQLVEHVGQRFCMHEAVLDGHMEQQMGRAVLVGAVLCQSFCRQPGIDRVPHPRHVVLHLVTRRPIGGLIGREPTSYWIDAKGKNLIKLGVERRLPQNPLAQQIPVKCLQMPGVENDAMSLGNGTFVQEF